MKNIEPFTKENYLKGYSRNDAEKELAYYQRQREDLNKRMKSNLENSKRLETELKRSGRTES
jgi:hypothetical protein